jgi:hypothetical protein
VVSSFYSTKFQRHIEELLVAPVSNWVILAGYIGGGVARGVLVGSKRRISLNKSVLKATELFMK